jgi:hypothetical protein
MMQGEKDKLIDLFDDQRRWCCAADAQDARGKAVHFDDTSAVAWDLVGGLCHLFGWKRANKLFGPLSRHFSGKPRSAGLRHLSTDANNEMAAMTALLDFNDDVETTYELIVSKLHDLPVWHGRTALG